MTQLVQILLGIVMYALMGLIVGVGVIIVQEYPKVGEFLKTRPVLGWTAAFALGYTIHSVIMYLFEVALLAILAVTAR